jgi:hypothetical protein
MFGRIHSLKIDQPCSWADVIHKFPLPFAFHQHPCLILNCRGLKEPQCARCHLPPRPLLQNRDFKDTWVATLQIQQGVLIERFSFTWSNAAVEYAADFLYCPDFSIRHVSFEVRGIHRK